MAGSSREKRNSCSFMHMTVRGAGPVIFHPNSNFKDMLLLAGFKLAPFVMKHFSSSHYLPNNFFNSL